MVQVYTIDVFLEEFEKEYYRQIKVSSGATVARLVYTVLSSFHLSGTHLYSLKYNNTFFEIKTDDPWLQTHPVIDPTSLRIYKLELKVGDELEILYDFNLDWRFKVKVVEINDIATNKKGKNYPKVKVAMGDHLLESTPKETLRAYINQVDETNSPIALTFPLNDEKIWWDYREVNIDQINGTLKENAIALEDYYENLEDQYNLDY